ncbi:Uncharacterised protein [Chlamydia trachomatis]|nr:Uncharacterised protein [Chlamydia trachomatis]CRH86654.1 Uncharacterised protein [Chlamydia trachomatis]
MQHSPNALFQRMHAKLKHPDTMNSIEPFALPQKAPLTPTLSLNHRPDEHLEKPLAKSILQRALPPILKKGILDALKTKCIEQKQIHPLLRAEETDTLTVLHSKDLDALQNKRI